MHLLPSLLALLALTSVSALRAEDTAPADLYLLMGQSNMVGRDSAGLKDQATNPRVLVCTSADTWRVACEPLDPATGSGMGPGTSFGAAILSGDATIGLIPTAVGGTPLSRWVKGGDLYENALRRAKAALKTGGHLVGVVWHQGESDSISKHDADTYQARLVQMFTDLRADLGRPDLPIVIGQIGDFLQLPYKDTVRAALRDMPNHLAHVAFVDSTGLPHKGDHLHFTSAAQQELGRRYAAAMKILRSRATDAR